MKPLNFLMSSKAAILTIGIGLAVFLVSPNFTNNKEQLSTEENLNYTIDSSRDHEGDTFSVVAYDPVTGEIGGAGCSCYGGNINFLNDIIFSSGGTLLGAIHTQAAYTSCNQDRARARMLAGDTPAEIITYMENNDCNNSKGTRQYGIVGIDGSGTITTAGFTGTSNGNWAGNITGVDPNTGMHYAIQGNILDTSTDGAGRQDILDDMETAFRNSTGTLADKLMAALQGAKRVGGDNRCADSGNSGKASFIRVQKPTDPVGNPSINLWEYPNVNYIEPIDVLQCTYDAFVSTPFCRETVNTFPYVMDFETKSWEKEETCDIDNAWIRSRFATPTSNTGPSGANQGALYAFVESSDLGSDNFNNRAVIGSPCFELPYLHSATMTFDYHMYGTNMGVLSVTASIDGGASWTTLWSESGNQGNSWVNNETIDLTQFHGKTVKLRFDATTGSDYLSDMAIDDINITVAPGISCLTTTTFSSASGGSWSNGAPTISTTAIINHDFDTATFGSIEACEIIINNGKTLTVNADDYVSSVNNITVNGDLVVAHEGSLVQVDDTALATNNGNITIEKITPTLAEKTFMVMGSPMTSETREDVYATAYIVRHHNTANFVPNEDVNSAFPAAENFADDNGNNWLTHTGGLNPAEGYLVFPQPSTTGSGSFTHNYTEGTLNTGEITYPLAYHTNQNSSPNILSNPYASAIDADAFYAHPANAAIDVLYFWEHITPLSTSYPGYKAENFSMGDISIYSEAMGGVAAANGGSTPTSIISSGQGFGLKAPSEGITATFNNAMRVTGSNDTYRRPASERDRLWINVYNDSYGLGSTTLIGFSETTTNDFEAHADIKRLATPVSIYSELETGEELAINALAPFEIEASIGLSFSTQVKEMQNYRMSLQEFDGINLETATVYLIDTFTGAVTNLSEGDYTFQSEEGTFSERFKVVFQEQILGTNDTTLATVSVYPNPTQNVLYITSPQVITNTTVFDAQGRIVLNTKQTGTSKVQVDLSNLKSALYFVEITTENGTLTKRVIKE